MPSPPLPAWHDLSLSPEPWPGPPKWYPSRAPLPSVSRTAANSSTQPCKDLRLRVPGILPGPGHPLGNGTVPAPEAPGSRQGPDR